MTDKTRPTHGGYPDALVALDEVIPPHLRASRHGEGFMGQHYDIIRHTLMTGLAHNDAIAALNELAALQHQEVPREPVAWLRHDGMKAMPADEKEAWIEAGQPEIAADYTIPLYSSTTRQQEANADADAEYHSWFPVYAGVRMDAQGQPWQRIEDADLAEMERWIENGGSRRAFFIPIDGDRLANFTLHMIREVRATRQQEAGIFDKTGERIAALGKQAGFNMEPTGNMLYTVRGNHAQLINFARLVLAAAPSTPENAGGVPDGVGGTDGR